jgi:hypothetical protein
MDNGAGETEVGCLNEAGAQERDGYVREVEIKKDAGAHEERASEELTYVLPKHAHFLFMKKAPRAARGSTIQTAGSPP